MEKVEAIGGIFFRAKDPAALAAWYHEKLGINPVPQDPEGQPWMQEAGPTVFAPFAEDTDYFGRMDQQWMLNFRVRDLDAMIAQLEAAGIEIGRRDDMEGIGRFARIHDPEGNPIELWEPVAP
ncbi:VOC family protein [Cognatiyoonia sp. IB215446]|uniref:VOC family protein n=1 Tax=Cognatiyoonia sp. IB215446 TaxID=3097355 RepID=UPI002A101FDB|nr:VOC family protein [Cognatiyoonia sp. IB215446]MDX8348663.1 VOC family protein [Cognatiyoonia sp. IB215446]